MPVEGKASPAAPAVRQVQVTEDEAGQRIDNYLIARLKGVPKSHIYRILRGGEVRINSRRVEASRKVVAGDRIRIPPVRVAERGDAEPPPHYALPVLFEDEFLLAIDKPVGDRGARREWRGPRGDRVAARRCAARRASSSSCTGWTGTRRACCWSPRSAPRSPRCTRCCARATWTSATWSRSKGRFRNELQRVRARAREAPHREGERRVSVSEGGQEAETVFRRLSRGAEASLLEAELLTGRTHQIRVHLAHLGHPVLGDDEVRRFRAQQAPAHATG